MTVGSRNRGQKKDMTHNVVISPGRTGTLLTTDTNKAFQLVKSAIII